MEIGSESILNCEYENSSEEEEENRFSLSTELSSRRLSGHGKSPFTSRQSFRIIESFYDNPNQLRKAGNVRNSFAMPKNMNLDDAFAASIFDDGPLISTTANSQTTTDDTMQSFRSDCDEEDVDSSSDELNSVTTVDFSADIGGCVDLNNNIATTVSTDEVTVLHHHQLPPLYPSQQQLQQHAISMDADHFIFPHHMRRQMEKGLNSHNSSFGVQHAVDRYEAAETTDTYLLVEDSFIQDNSTEELLPSLGDATVISRELQLQQLEEALHHATTPNHTADTTADTSQRIDLHHHIAELAWELEYPLQAIEHYLEILRLLKQELESSASSETTASNHQHTAAISNNSGDHPTSFTRCLVADGLVEAEADADAEKVLLPENCYFVEHSVAVINQLAMIWLESTDTNINNTNNTNNTNNNTSHQQAESLLHIASTLKLQAYQQHHSSDSESNSKLLVIQDIDLVLLLHQLYLHDHDQHTTEDANIVDNQPREQAEEEMVHVQFSVAQLYFVKENWLLSIEHFQQVLALLTEMHSSSSTNNADEDSNSHSTMNAHSAIKDENHLYFQELRAQVCATLSHIYEEHCHDPVHSLLYAKEAQRLRDSLYGEMSSVVSSEAAGSAAGPLEQADILDLEEGKWCVNTDNNKSNNNNCSSSGSGGDAHDDTINNIDNSTTNTTNTNTNNNTNTIDGNNSTMMHNANSIDSSFGSTILGTMGGSSGDSTTDSCIIS